MCIHAIWELIWFGSACILLRIGISSQRASTESSRPLWRHSETEKRKTTNHRTTWASSSSRSRLLKRAGVTVYRVHVVFFSPSGKKRFIELSDVIWFRLPNNVCRGCDASCVNYCCTPQRVIGSWFIRTETAAIRSDSQVQNKKRTAHPVRSRRHRSV